MREACLAEPRLASSVAAIKGFQSLRFAGTYADLLSSPRFKAAARFFLEELYSDKDYAERDAQFSRIAGAMQKFFPQQVVATAVSLARLHALTEALDHAMGQAWLAQDGLQSEVARYISAWRTVGRRPEREGQLSIVMDIGMEMARLTRTPGLRMMLRMMRGPAAAAGLGSLQRFLESGFDTFAAMARQRGSVEEFLEIIRARESTLIAALFDMEFVSCETQLQQLIGVAR